jgi:formylglycine-generating enzyme required for sulfatase activity/tRNA A-37 threonylcarbamoyl transferase component Bud32
MPVSMRLAQPDASVADAPQPLDVETEAEVARARDDCHGTVARLQRCQRHAVFFCTVSGCSAALNRRQTGAAGRRGRTSEQNLMAESRTTGKGAEETIDSTRAGLTGPPVDGLHVGSVVDRYIIVERVGAGAMGVVYSAFDPKLDRKVALKLLRQRPDRTDQQLRQERLVREAKAIAKLSHANIVGIFDVGVHQGEVLLAMEYLSGGTLRRWISAEKRHWRDVIKKFSEVGQGLDAAHAAGLIHRDFKSDNVLLDGSGVPKIVDFGLVRLAESTDVEISSDETDDDVEPTSNPGFGPLTRTGALLGTPGYMAPEQFLGKPTDARSDQFAFCASLYHALYGERPFAGEAVTEIAEQVTKGRVRPASADSAVPGWIRKVLLRGLATEPAQRYPSMSTLLHALAVDPVARRRRLIAIAAGVAVVTAIVVGVQRRAEQRHSELEHRIAARLADANNAFAEAKAFKEKALPLRGRAFALFDARDREGGERVWSEARAASTSFDAALDRAQRALEATLAMDQRRSEVRRRLSEVLVERAALAEIESRRDDVARHMASLDAVDVSGEQRERWRQPGSLSIRTVPSGAKISLERYDSDSAPRISQVPLGAVLSSPVTGHSLLPGSYRLRIEKAGYVDTLYPLLIKRGEPISLDIELPTEGEIPKGFVYVPSGKFLYGDHDEELRKSFLDTAPLHERRVDGFLINAYETTFSEWIAFLSALSSREREVRRPHGSSIEGAVTVTAQHNSDWTLQLNISRQVVKAATGEKLIYPKRANPALAAQDWLKMPVVGVSVRDITAYFGWLRATGKVPGARFCTEAEWERAARGADERAYPASLAHLDGADANVDVTYGRMLGAYGPDEVGRHPRSQSPFGLFDMVGNVWEFVMDEQMPDSFVARGGGYYHDLRSARITNRQTVEVELRNHFIGFRVCADWRKPGKGDVGP